MKIQKLCLSISLCSAILIVGCGKDKNLDDQRREQDQQNKMRVSAIQGSYSGVAISNIDKSNLGNIILNFKANTNSQSSSLCRSGFIRISGSINLKSLSTTEVTFSNGCYEDISGDFDVSVPVTQSSGVPTVISLSGNISGDSWIGTIEVNGQPQSGAILNLRKNAPPSNSSQIEVAGARLEQMRRLGFPYVGTYLFNGNTGPIELAITSHDLSPELTLFNLLSPVREVALNVILAGFNLNFSNALLNDNTGVLIAHDPTDQQGRPTKVNLVCNKFEVKSDFGWDCDIQIKSVLLKSHLSVKR